MDFLTISSKHKSLFTCNQVVSQNPAESSEIAWKTCKGSVSLALSGSMTCLQVSNVLPCATDSLNVSFKCGIIFWQYGINIIVPVQLLLQRSGHVSHG